GSKTAATEASATMAQTYTALRVGRRT
ncbi:MAG: hypothetical protein QOD73_1174, partial [Solirubrobacteraceae bacterium]|nr:hypothetical protein [Solirubrobacteraceae bacterium]